LSFEEEEPTKLQRLKIEAVAALAGDLRAEMTEYERTG
jgi:hypothetical protein